MRRIVLLAADRKARDTALNNQAEDSNLE